MDDFNFTIIVPTPVYQIDAGLRQRLTAELQLEREKSLMLSRELELQKHKAQQLEAYLKTLNAKSLESKVMIPTSSSEDKFVTKIDSLATLASTADLQCKDLNVAQYSSETRKEKILRYKEKVKKYREKVIISRSFSGRSEIAKGKPRLNGKFIKSGELKNEYLA